MNDSRTESKRQFDLISLSSSSSFHIYIAFPDVHLCRTPAAFSQCSGTVNKQEESVLFNYVLRSVLLNWLPGEIVVCIGSVCESVSLDQIVTNTTSVSSIDDSAWGKMSK